MDDQAQTKNDSKEVISYKNLKSQKSWEEVFKELK
ncbi:MAG: hypothetical protein RLZZ81_602 [Pseudomonadota bacterium]|jgi:hypothetical protein